MPKDSNRILNWLCKLWNVSLTTMSTVTKFFAFFIFETMFKALKLVEIVNKCTLKWKKATEFLTVSFIAILEFSYCIFFVCAGSKKSDFVTVPIYSPPSFQSTHYKQPPKDFVISFTDPSMSPIQKVAGSSRPTHIVVSPNQVTYQKRKLFCQMQRKKVNYEKYCKIKVWIKWDL